MYPSLCENDDLESFDEIIADGSGSTRSAALLSMEACSIQSSMCFAVEGLMTTLFTPPGCDWSDNNSLAELTNSTTDSLEALPRRREDMVKSPSGRSGLSPRKVCSLWKKKRKAEKKRLMELREQQDDLELHSEIKLSALGIQRSFERKVPSDESDEERHRATYEKYGSRAEFIRDHRQ